MRVLGRLQLLLAATVAAIALAPSSALGAGMTTHAWMAEVGVDSVETPELKQILRAHPAEVMSGAQFPDSGYAPGVDFGETAHWEDFTDAYARHIRAKEGCEGTLSDPSGPCAKLIAHLMGVAAHGMGDEMWDWLFEPTMADHGEHPSSMVRSRVDDTPGFAELSTAPGGTQLQQQAIDLEHAGMDAISSFFGDLIGSSEYAMDVVAINDHQRYVFSPVPPPVDDILAIYESLGQPQSRQELMQGHAFISTALAAERLSVAEAHTVRADFPYSSQHMKTDPGGVDHTGVAVGGYYESVWAKLGGANPAPEVVQVTPAPGSTGVPVRWQPARTSPGPTNGGGARNRIFAALSNAVDDSTVTPDSFRLFDSDGNPVAPHRPEFPKAGPYHPSQGTHSMLFYPATDLEPCETYTAELTTAVRNRKGLPLPSAHRWSFTTESGDGSECPEPPATPPTPPRAPSGGETPPAEPGNDPVEPAPVPVASPAEGAPHCDGLKLSRLEGKTLRRARTIAKDHGCIVRVVKRNGESLAVTDDHRVDRINVAVRSGRVVRATGVG